MTFPQQDQIIRTLAFIALTVVMGPCQIYIQVSYYAEAFTDADKKLVWAALAGALFVIEAAALSLIAHAIKCRAWGRALAFSIVLIPTMFVTYNADVGGFTTQLSRGEASRQQARNFWDKNKTDADDIDVEIEGLTAALPQSHRGKTTKVLEIERQGLARRIALYASPPPGLLTRQTQLESAIATRDAIDQANVRRETLRSSIVKPPPEIELPEFASVAAFLKLVGIDVSAADMKALLPSAFTLTIKFMMIAGFGIAGVTAAYLHPSNQPAVSSANTQPTTSLGSSPPLQPGPSPATKPAAANKAKPAAGIAQIVRNGLNGRHAPPQP